MMTHIGAKRDKIYFERISKRTAGIMGTRHAHKAPHLEGCFFPFGLILADAI